MIKLLLNIDPVPASRYKATRYGGYYPGRYTGFRNEVQPLIRKAMRGRAPLTGDLRFSVVFNKERPKKTDRSRPIGDLDNYMKAIMDSLNEQLWVDDDQVVEFGRCRKQWAAPGSPGSILLTATRV